MFYSGNRLGRFQIFFLNFLLLFHIFCIFSTFFLVFVLTLLLLILAAIIFENPVFFHQNLKLGLIDIHVDFFIAVRSIDIRGRTDFYQNIRNIWHFDSPVLRPQISRIRQFLKKGNIAHIIRMHTKFNMIFQGQTFRSLFESLFRNSL